MYAYKDRIAWIDAAKGIGIVLVVIGHVIRGLTASHLLGWTPAIQFVDDWIYSFHMPLFFFLAGLFFFDPAKRSAPSFLAGKIRTIAYPYFLWSIITVLLKSVMGSLPNTPHNLSDLPQILYLPIEQFWFLYALFLLAAILGCLYASGIGMGMPFLAALALYAIPINTGLPILNVAISYAIFVAAGALIGTFQIKNIPSVGLVGLALSIVFISCQMPPLLSATSGIIGAISLASILARSRVLIFLGHHSLEIFAAHTIASASVRIILVSFHVRSIAVHFFVAVLAGVLFPLCLVRFRILFALPRTFKQASQVVNSPPS